MQNLNHIKFLFYFKCFGRRLTTENKYLQQNDQQSEPLIILAYNEHNDNNNNNNGNEKPTFAINRMKRHLFEWQPSETKQFKSAFSLNPAIMQGLNSIVSFGKSHPEKSATYCSISNTMSTTDGSSSDYSSMYQSGGTHSSSNSQSVSGSSSSSSSSSFSSSNNQTTSQQGQEASSSLSNSPSSSSGNSSSSSSAGSSSSSSASFASSSSEDSLPTNADYYPIETSETQSNDDFNDSQQYDEGENTSSHDKHKSAWSNLMNAPAHFIQKMRKMHADHRGMGAFYGSDHFAKNSNKSK